MPERVRTLTEETETHIDHLESGLDVSAGPDSFSSDDRNVFGTDDGEDGRSEAAQESFEASKVTGRDVLAECASVGPVAESVGVALRVTSDHGYEGEEEEHEDQDDFAAGQPELGLSEGADCEHVDEAVWECQWRSIGNVVETHA